MALIRMRRPLEKVAKVLLRNSRSRRFNVQSTRDQSVAVKPSSRATAGPLEPLGVTCPFKSASSEGNVYIPTGPESYAEPPSAKIFRRTTEDRPLASQHDAGSSSRSNSETAILPFSNVPSPPGLPFIGTLFEFIKFGGGTMLHEYNLRRHNQLGPIYKENIAGSTTLFVADPDLFNEVQRQEGHFPQSLKQDAFKLYNQLHPELQNRGVFFLEGEEWWKSRRALNPVFLKRAPSITQQVMGPVEDYLCNYFQNWELLCSEHEGRLPNAEIQMYKLGFEGVSHIIFGRLYERNWNRLKKDLHVLLRGAQVVFEENNKMLVLPAKLAQRLNLQTWRNFDSSLNYLLKTGQELTKLCIQDLENVDPATGLKEAGMLYRMYSEANLTHEELVDVTNGFVTTIDPPAVTLGWLLNTLGQHPEIQESIYEEVMDVCGRQDPPRFSHLQDLRSVKMFIKETMRLYPMAPFLARIMPEESTIGGYQVPAKQPVALSLYACNLNAKYFPQPLRFMPERWERKGSSDWGSRDIQRHCSHYAVQDPTAFRPFGTGKRSCLGKLVAETISQLFVAHVVQKFQIKSDPVKPKMSTVMVPDRPLNIRLKRRT